TRAFPALDRAAALAPRNADIRLTLGLAYLNLQDPVAARREFSEAAALDPSLAEAHLGLAMAGTPGAPAQSELQEYARRAAGRAGDPVLLCRTLTRLGQAPEAIRQGRLAVLERPTSPAAWQ